MRHYGCIAQRLLRLAKRQPSNRMVLNIALDKRIQRIYDEHAGRYGYRIAFAINGSTPDVKSSGLLRPITTSNANIQNWDIIVL
nr:hypothetical protein [Formosimonas limnophila]